MDQPGGPFAKIPVYDQKLYSNQDSNICYAISASELIDARRFHDGDERLAKLTSPVAVALNYKLGTNSFLDPKRPESLGRGDELHALNSVNRKMVCDQRWLSQFFGRKNVDRFVSSILDDIAIYQKSMSRLNNRAANGPSCGQPSLKRDQIGNLSDLLEIVRAAAIKSNPLERAAVFIAGLCKGHEIFVNIPAPQSLVTNMPSDKMMDEITTLLHNPEFNKAEVRDKYKLYLHQLKIDKERASALKLAKVNELLDGPQPIPVAISFNPGVFHQNEESSIGNHNAVIIGRRSTEDGCEFLVRDSYGPSCLGSDGKARYSFPCTRGSVWIPAGRLMKATYGLTWIPH
jgi:hypothetical protein